MYTVKTTENDNSVTDFINSVPDENKRKDSFALLEIFKEVTGLKPKLWGTSIIGFGSYHSKSESTGQEFDWMLTGFSPRKQALTIYFMSGTNNFSKSMEKLGKFKTSKGSCVYIKKLSDIDIDVLKDLLDISVKEMKSKYNIS